MDNQIKLEIPLLPPNCNQYIGRTNIWQYHADRKKFTSVVKVASYGVNKCFDKCTIDITYTFPDMRRRDPNNLDKCLLDALVENNLIKDDNWQCVVELTERGRYEKGVSKVEIIIKQL